MKEIELEFTTKWQADELHVNYYSDGPKRNRLMDVFLNGYYPLDTSELATNPRYAKLYQHIKWAMQNNSHSYWEEEQEKEVANA
ncbi:MAG: hypothetical protein IPQ27_12885 [Chitinophagaceae bacterium]|jgi:hypothetical protein|nr:hypothetical protein [Chitinophagaceae bacterium]MBK9959116.1 hypothetical protein [Chitinophagaceae bacterium]MBL0255781.1 hypothetical protein [Chitinophagaceae bacterium]